MNLKKTLIQVSLLAVFFLIAFLITLAGKKHEYVNFVGFTQGTTYHISYESKEGISYQASVDSLLASFDRTFSIYQPGSVISRINRNEPGTAIDSQFAFLFRKSYDIFEQTGGAFDITVGPIVNALGFGSGDTLKVDSVLIDSLLPHIGMEKVSLSKGRLIKSDEHIVLDVNAIAQGYSVDLVAEFLEGKSIRNYMIEIGGEVRAHGKNESNRIWNIGIDKPEEGNSIPGANLQAVVSLKNKSLATSGNYRKFYVKNGIKFVHTIDPHTGYPVISNLLSATVIAKDCTTADAYATSLMVMGLDKSIEFLKTHTFLEAYLIYADEKGEYQVYTTPGLEK